MGLWNFFFGPRVSKTLSRAQKLIRKQEATQDNPRIGRICLDWIGKDGLSVSYTLAMGKMGEILEVKQIWPNNRFEYYYISHIDPDGYRESGVLKTSTRKQYTDLTTIEKNFLISMAVLIRKNAGIANKDSALCRDLSPKKGGVNEPARSD